MRWLFWLIAVCAVSAVAQTSSAGSDECDPRLRSFCWYRPGPGITNPVPIYQPEPQYSEEARKAKLQGSVLVEVLVGRDGRPVNAEVLRPLGLGLDAKAIEALWKWKFKPGRKDGNAVAVRIQIEIAFRLPAEYRQATWRTHDCVA